MNATIEDPRFCRHVSLTLEASGDSVAVYKGAPATTAPYIARFHMRERETFSEAIDRFFATMVG